MDPLLGLGLISGIGSLGSSLINTFGGQQMSKDLMDYQYKLQQDAIDKANLYNSPQQQMKRLAEAQLNPNLVYGHGVDGNQSSPASPGIINKRGEFQNPLQDLPTAYMQQKELELAQIKTRNEAFEARSRTKLNEAKTLNELTQGKYLDATLKDRIKQASQRLANDVTKGDLMRQQTNNLEIMANNLVEQTNLLVARTRLTNEQAATEVTKRELAKHKIYLTDKQANEAYEMIQFIGAGTKLRKLGYNMQNTAYEATKIYNEWKKKHPNMTLTLDMVKDIVGIGKDIAQGVGALIP